MSKAKNAVELNGDCGGDRCEPLKEWQRGYEADSFKVEDRANGRMELHVH